MGFYRVFMNNLQNKEISAIVPFYNEEKFIEQSISRLIDSNLFKKIILVYDKSSDNSVQIAEKICEQFDFTQLINLDNKIKTASLGNLKLSLQTQAEL